MIDDFVAAIREDRAPGVTGEDGLRAVEIVAAAYQSVAKGQPVKM
jgi:predicted dehydrogenase